jgi:hypothetical protein
MTATFREDPADESARVVGDSPKASGGIVAVDEMELSLVVEMVAEVLSEDRPDVAANAPGELLEATSCGELEEVWAVEEGGSEDENEDVVGVGVTAKVLEVEVEVGNGGGGDIVEESVETPPFCDETGFEGGSAVGAVVFGIGGDPPEL